MKNFKSLLSLFFTMFKIGLFTFGGGYAMISFFENEFVNKKKLLSSDEFLDLIAIAESTPGPIAINCATYIGYKQNKFLGSFVSTIAMCLPSFVIIFIISLFFNQFLEIAWVSNAFKGIQVCVVFLILSAGIKLFKNMKKNLVNIISIFVLTTIIVLISLFEKSFSSIVYILLALIVGVIIYSFENIKNYKSSQKEDKKWFLSFLKIGAATFGGGYAMIPLIKDECLSSGWLTNDELLNFIAIAESTPGPISVNMATFVGSSQAGFWGSFVATLGVILPSFIVILLIASVIKNLLKFKSVQTVLKCIRPVIVALILSTGITLLLQIIFGITSINSTTAFNFIGIIIFEILIIIVLLFKIFKKKKPSPVLMILISGLLGILLF